MRYLSYVFTDFQPNDERGQSIAKEYEAAATSRGSKFIPVIMSLDAVYNEARLLDNDRASEAAHKKGVLTDVRMLRLLREDVELHKFESAEELTLNVEGRTAPNAAVAIAGHIRKVMRQKDEPAKDEGSDA